MSALEVEITIDCADPDRLARFWAEALGYRVQPRRWEQYVVAVDPERKRPRIVFQKVPEAKTVKNRVHLDLRASGPRETPPAERRARVEAEADRLARLGATKVGPVDEPAMDFYWIVMRDPDGNEFCVV